MTATACERPATALELREEAEEAEFAAQVVTHDTLRERVRLLDLCTATELMHEAVARCSVDPWLVLLAALPPDQLEWLVDGAWRERPARRPSD